MAEITSYTAERIKAIEDAEIVSANIDAGGHFTLTRNDDEIIDGGEVPVGTPSGALIMFAGDSIPSGWLLCNGQAISRSGYANLFAAIGTIHGNGDGSTTFNVPNMELKLPRMQAGALGDTGGGSGHTHTVATHTHTIGTHTHTINDHDHDLNGGSPQGHARVNFASTGAPNIFIDRFNSSNWNATHHGDATYVAGDSSSQDSSAKLAGRTVMNGNDTNAATGGNTGSGGNNTDSAVSLPPYLNLNFIIKA